MSEQVQPGPEQVHPRPQPGSPKEIVCALPDDWHLHLRDGDALKSVVLASALQFGRAIVMPNLKPPITRLSQALEYRDSIRNALKDQMIGMKKAEIEYIEEYMDEAEFWEYLVFLKYGQFSAFAVAVS